MVFFSVDSNSFLYLISYQKYINTFITKNIIPTVREINDIIIVIKEKNKIGVHNNI